MPGKLAVAVIGAGLMGHGIAQVFARQGHAVVLADRNQSAIQSAIGHIQRNLEQEGLDPIPVLLNLLVTDSVEKAVANADLVFEAISEKLDLKQELFAEVARHAPDHAVLASNTSVIPITRIGARLPAEARRRLVGTHWWNPPHLIPLVEVIRTEHTDAEVFEKTVEWLRMVGKKPVKVERDIPGFIGNRIQHAMWREAIALVEAGVCDADAIDTVVKHSFGLRLSVLGPIENADLVGLELTRDVHRVLFPDLCDSKTPSKLLDRLIAKGHTGMNAGRGLKSWTFEQADAVRLNLSKHLIGALRRQ